MVQAKPTTPIWNTADPLYTNVICALPFTDGLGAQATDLSGNGLHGTLINLGSGSTWFNDPTLGVVVQLDGATGYVALSSLLNAAILATPFIGASSVSMWLRLRNSTPSVSTKTGFMDLGVLDNPGTASKWPAGGSFGGETNGTGYLSTFRSSTRLNVGSLNATDKTQWHHVVITTQAGGNWKLYLNGVLFFTAAADNPLNVTLPPTLGRSSETGGAGPFYLDGWLGDFRVYNKELTAQEALGLFNSPWNLYTVSAPLGQQRLEALVADTRRELDYSTRVTALMGDATPGRSDYSVRQTVLMVDAVPLKDPNQSNTPPNNPGDMGLVGIASGFNPRHKPDQAQPPTLNGDAINTGIQLSFPFTEGVGNLTDRSANAHSGVLQGTAAWDATFSSFEFRTGALAPNVLFSTGTGNNNIKVNDHASLRPATAVTIAAVVRPRGFPSANGILAGKASAAAYSYALLVTTGGQFQFRLTDVIDGTLNVTGGSFSNALQSGPFLVVGTYDGSLQRLYVNGALVASSGQAGNISHVSPLDFYIGGDAFANGNCNCAVEKVEVWDRALSLAEIQQLYAVQHAGLNATAPIGTNPASGTYSNYSVGVLTDVVALVVDATPGFSEASTRSVALVVDAKPTREDSAARLVALIVDATPAIQNAAFMGVGSITPNTGTTQGGTSVTIRGFAFRNVTQVLVGGVLCTSVVVVNETTITAVTGAHIAGLVEVRVDSSSMGTAIAPNLYQYLGGLGSGSQALLRGKQFTSTLWHQDPPSSFYTGENAPLAVDTTLSFTLTDKPTTPEAVEVYVRRSGETGYGRMRYLLDFDVDITLRKIIWKGTTAAFALVPSDELIVAYPGQN